MFGNNNTYVISLIAQQDERIKEMEKQIAELRVQVASQVHKNTEMFYRVQEAIIKHLQENVEQRASALYRAICVEQKICSNKIFYQYLAQSVRCDSITRNEEARTKVSYSLSLSPIP